MAMESKEARALWRSYYLDTMLTDCENDLKTIQQKGFPNLEGISQSNINFIISSCIEIKRNFEAFEEAHNHLAAALENREQQVDVIEFLNGRFLRLVSGANAVREAMPEILDVLKNYRIVKTPADPVEQTAATAEPTAGVPGLTASSFIQPFNAADLAASIGKPPFPSRPSSVAGAFTENLGLPPTGSGRGRARSWTSTASRVTFWRRPSSEGSKGSPMHSVVSVATIARNKAQLLAAQEAQRQQADLLRKNQEKEKELKRRQIQLNADNKMLDLEIGQHNISANLAMQQQQIISEALSLQVMLLKTRSLSLQKLKSPVVFCHLVSKMPSIQKKECNCILIRM